MDSSAVRLAGFLLACLLTASCAWWFSPKVTVEQAERRTGLDVILPSYLPPDVSPKFGLELQGPRDDPQVVASYFRDDTHLGVMRLTQERAGLEIISIGGADKLSVGRATVFLYREGRDPGEIMLSASFDGRWVSLEYLAGEPRPRTELEMDILNVLQSLLDQ